MAETLPSSIIAGISFIGRGGGLVKALSGFRKGHHTIPDAVNAVTNAFLGKISETELSEQAEKLFQEVRTGLGYKRKDVSPAGGGGVAVLTTRAFVVEISYALEESDPSRYAVTTILRNLDSADLARSKDFDAIFRGKFSEISFALKKGAKVEAIVDVIEALDPGSGLAVRYPSDCSECVISVEGVVAEVRCTGATLEMVFPRAGSPAELIDGFSAVRGAFSISPDLTGLMSG